MSDVNVNQIGQVATYEMLHQYNTTNGEFGKSLKCVSNNNDTSHRRKASNYKKLHTTKKLDAYTYLIARRLSY